MIFIGVDFQPAYQEIASVNTNTGEYQERRLAHPEEAEELNRSLASVGQAVRIGMEASGGRDFGGSTIGAKRGGKTALPGFSKTSDHF